AGLVEADADEERALLGDIVEVAVRRPLDARDAAALRRAVLDLPRMQALVGPFSLGRPFAVRGAAALAVSRTEVTLLLALADAVPAAWDLALVGALRRAGLAEMVASRVALLVAAADAVAGAIGIVTVGVGAAWRVHETDHAVAVENAVAALQVTVRAAPVARDSVAVVALLERRRTLGMQHAITAAGNAAANAVVTIAVVAVVALLGGETEVGTECVDDLVAALRADARLAVGIAGLCVRRFALLDALLDETVAADRDRALR